MQTTPEQITPTFGPEMQFNVELSSRAALVEPFGPLAYSSQRCFVTSQEKPESRGVRFSALND